MRIHLREIAMALGLGAAAACGAPSQNDHRVSEYAGILNTLSEAARKFHDAHGRYPSLMSDFAVEVYCPGNRDIRHGISSAPVRASEWKPIGCDYLYRIDQATESAFRISAYKNNVAVAYVSESSPYVQFIHAS